MGYQNKIFPSTTCESSKIFTISLKAHWEWVFREEDDNIEKISNKKSLAKEAK